MYKYFLPAGIEPTTHEQNANQLSTTPTMPPNMYLCIPIYLWKQIYDAIYHCQGLRKLVTPMSDNWDRRSNRNRRHNTRDASTSTIDLVAENERHLPPMSGLLILVFKHIIFPSTLILITYVLKCLKAFRKVIIKLQDYSLFKGYYSLFPVLLLQTQTRGRDYTRKTVTFHFFLQHSHTKA